MSSGKVSLRSFVGRWSLLREIEDSAHNRSGRMVGEVVYRPSDEDGVLIYEETGQLMLEGLAPLMAERRYRWRNGRGNMVDVEFEDGRLFHHVNLDQTMPFDTHFCAPDVYDMTYDFREWPKWSSSARVEGPRKTYRLHSHYQYLGALDSKG